MKCVHHTPNPADLFLTRRDMLTRCGMGMGAAALTGVLGNAGMLKAATAGDLAAASAAGKPPSVAGQALNPLAARDPQFAGKAKHVIHLFMNGGPSQVDTFDPKPELTKYHGKNPPRDLQALNAKPGRRSSRRSSFKTGTARAGWKSANCSPKRPRRPPTTCVSFVPCTPMCQTTSRRSCS